MQLTNLVKKLQRQDDCHKGDFAHILIIGGDHGMGGAAIMATEAAFRVGAAKITTLTRNQHICALLSKVTNAMYLDENCKIAKALENKGIVAIGVGLGQSKWSRKIFGDTMRSKLAKIIDADALNLLAQSREKFDLKNCVITPHLGEAARLLNCSVEEIKNDKELAAKNLHEKFGATVILKGFHSIIFGKDEQIHHCQYGNSAMAVAGMGDILTGIVAGLMSQGFSATEAAYLGASAHGHAGDLAAQKIGKIGIVPNDLLEFLPRIVGDGLWGSH